MLPPFLKIAAHGSCGHKSLRRLHDDLTIHEIKNRKVTARRPGGDHTATSRFLQLLQVCRTAAVRAPHGRRKDAVRPPFDFLGTQDRGKPYATSRSSQGDRTATVQWPCGVVAALRFLKKSSMSSKKTARLAMILRRAKNRKVAVRIWGLRSPYGRRKHAASYMWPWHYWAHCVIAFVFLKMSWYSLSCCAQWVIWTVWHVHLSANQGTIGSDNG